jgi:hypothetical protein
MVILKFTLHHICRMEWSYEIKKHPFSYQIPTFLDFRNTERLYSTKTQGACRRSRLKKMHLLISTLAVHAYPQNLALTFLKSATQRTQHQC